MITPQVKTYKLAKKIGIHTDLFLKREDLHPLGSHKGRSIPIMMQKYIDQGYKKFSISSSGNAALAAIFTANDYNKKNINTPINLTVFVGRYISQYKLELIKTEAEKDRHIIVKQIQNPKQAAFLTEKNGEIKNLRQSTDDTALLGYESLAQELSQISNLSAVFIPTSSGTLAQGLFQAFKNQKLNPQIHIIQTSFCHPFVGATEEQPTSTSLATAIVDKVAHRAKQIKLVLKQSNGMAWMAQDSEIIEAINLVKQNEQIEISPNSALSIVGLKKAVLNGVIFSGPVVCILTGR